MNHDFSVQNRQSIIAIVLIIYKTVRVVVRQVWPLLIIVLVGGNASSYSDYLLPIVIGVSLFSMIWAVLSYFKYYFYIKDDELVIEKGVLSKTKLNIPFDRIQSVNFQQNIIHQITNVKKLEIDTAGSSGSEFSMEALSLEKADALRDLILKRKQELNKTTPLQEHIVEDVLDVEEERTLILNLSIEDLIKIGVSQNHFRSAGVIFAGLFYVLSQLSEIGLNVDDKIEGYIRQGILPGIIAIIGIIILFFIISFLITLVRSVLVYYNLNLWRIGDKYKLEKGLLTRKETTAVDQKIQIMEWSDNPLKRLFNLFDVHLKQASSVAQSKSVASIVIPGCSPTHVETLQNNWLSGLESQSFDKHSVSHHYLVRKLFYGSLFGALFICLVYIFKPQFILAPIAYTIFILITSWLQYKKRKYAVTDDVLYIGRGTFGFHHAIMPLFKIQSVSLTQSLYETRRDLASVNVMTASGSMLIPFIPVQLARKLNDYLLFSIESSRKNWM
jgi:putative membrane protein